MSKREYLRKYYKNHKYLTEALYKSRLEENLKGKNYKVFNGYYVTDQDEIFNKFGNKLNGHKQPNGYITVNIDGKFFYKHRLVWMAFFGRIEENMEIDFINNNRDDCRLKNLRLMNSKQNKLNPLSIETYKKTNKGKKRGKTIPIVQIKNDVNIATYKSAAEAGRILGTTSQTILNCCWGKQSGWNGYQFEKINKNY